MDQGLGDEAFYPKVGLELQAWSCLGDKWIRV